MKISTKGRYGLRAFVDLATYYKEAPVSIASIAERQDISESYLEQLMALLKKADLVNSIRGSGGGYVLAKDASEITVGDVLRALEGNIEPAFCAGLGADEDCCEARNCCVTKYVWKVINDSVKNAVDSILISDLVEKSNKGEDDNEQTHLSRQCCNH